MLLLYTLLLFATGFGISWLRRLPHHRHSIPMAQSHEGLAYFLPSWSSSHLPHTHLRLSGVGTDEPRDSPCICQAYVKISLALAGLLDQTLGPSRHPPALTRNFQKPALRIIHLGLGQPYHFCRRMHCLTSISRGVSTSSTTNYFCAYSQPDLRDLKSGDKPSRTHLAMHRSS